jgi:hypothetical protein
MAQGTMLNPFPIETGTPTVPSGATLINNSVKKSGRVVFAQVTVQKTMVLNQWNHLCTFPNGFRPSSIMSFAAMNSTRSCAVEGKIESDGKFSVYPTSDTASASAQNMGCSIAFII